MFSTIKDSRQRIFQSFAKRLLMSHESKQFVYFFYLLWTLLLETVEWAEYRRILLLRVEHSSMSSVNMSFCILREKEGERCSRAAKVQGMQCHKHSSKLGHHDIDRPDASHRKGTRRRQELLAVVWLRLIVYAYDCIWSSSMQSFVF